MSRLNSIHLPLYTGNVPLHYICLLYVILIFYFAGPAECFLEIGLDTETWVGFDPTEALRMHVMRQPTITLPEEIVIEHQRDYLLTNTQHGHVQVNSKVATDVITFKLQSKYGHKN